jgi:DNA polymerase-4
MKTAYKMCPHAVFLPVDYEAYSSASVKFREVLRTVKEGIRSEGPLD